MRKSLRWLYLLFILAGPAGMVVSCSVGTCFDPTEAKVKGTFYSTETGKALAPDSVKLFGIGTGGDSIWVYNKALDLRKAEFPLFAGDTVCKFVIDVNGTSDTIVYSYKSYLKLLSKECGYTYYHTVDTIYYTAHSIDSIAFLKNTVTTLNEENLRIYY